MLDLPMESVIGDIRKWVWGYRENDPMGGYDPYSASKGCSELVTSSYRNSFFNLDEYGSKHNTLIASARAGNVIGGGDWPQHTFKAKKKLGWQPEINLNNGISQVYEWYVQQFTQ